MSNLTQEIYKAHQDPKVRAMMEIPDMSQRDSAAQQLDLEGFIIDRQIMIWGWDAYLVMAYRAGLGYPWVPNAFQPNVSVPGLSLIGQTPTDFTHPWPRSIKVSTDAADYPPFEQIPPPVPLKAVGVLIGNGMYAADLSVVFPHGQWAYKTGDTVTQDGKTFKFTLGYNIMGPSPYWTEA